MKKGKKKITVYSQANKLQMHLNYFLCLWCFCTASNTKYDFLQQKLCQTPHFLLLKHKKVRWWWLFMHKTINNLIKYKSSSTGTLDTCTIIWQKSYIWFSKNVFPFKSWRYGEFYVDVVAYLQMFFYLRFCFWVFNYRSTFTVQYWELSLARMGISGWDLNLWPLEHLMMHLAVRPPLVIGAWP